MIADRRTVIGISLTVRIGSIRNIHSNRLTVLGSSRPAFAGQCHRLHCTGCLYFLFFTLRLRGTNILFRRNAGACRRGGNRTFRCSAGSSQLFSLCQRQTLPSHCYGHQDRQQFSFSLHLFTPSCTLPKECKPSLHFSLLLHFKKLNH